MRRWIFLDKVSREVHSIWVNLEARENMELSGHLKELRVAASQGTMGTGESGAGWVAGFTRRAWKSHVKPFEFCPEGKGEPLEA